MEQITAKDWMQNNHPLYFKELEKYGLREIVCQMMRTFASLRSVSETKEPDGWIQVAGNNPQGNFYKVKPDLKEVEFMPVYFSPVPVSEVGQMEAIRNKFFNECVDESNNEYGVTCKINIDPHDCFEWFKKNLLPVPNTKTQEREDIKEVSRLILLQVEHNKECGKDDKFTIDEISDIIDRRILKPFSSLRSNEPEREGRTPDEMFEIMAKTNFFENGLLYDIRSSNNKPETAYNIAKRLFKEGFLCAINGPLSPPLKALSEETKECPQCDGYGNFEGGKTMFTKCITCNGTGRVPEVKEKGEDE